MFRAVLLAGLLSAAAASSLAQPLLPRATPLQALRSDEECNRCTGMLLPGAIVPHPETKWGIISDLPETIKSAGLLYTTRDIIPENGAAEDLRRQRKSHGFAAIDGGFDVFLFHVIKGTTDSMRIVVTVRNRGEESVTIRPAQVIKTEGIIGTVHDFESDLGMRTLGRDWDRPLQSVAIPPGELRVIAYGRRFGAAANGPDSSTNVNCFGYVRALVEPATGTDLEVSVIAIPPVELADVEQEVGRWENVHAVSSDDVPLTEKTGCALGRAVGVYPNFIFKSEPVIFDVAQMDDATTFPMALPAIQTRGCERARQTHDLVLRPGYTREDTIGNYMIEHEVRFVLVNSSDAPKRANVRFGKHDADIGLAFRAGVAEGQPLNDDIIRAANMQSRWAGPKQKELAASFFAEPIEVPPQGIRTVALQFLICGNSSLPFYLSVVPAE